MIFASDLDQTLIYSRRAFRTDVAEEEIQLIETLEGREISFMTKEAIKLLSELASNILFIPVTTRTREQYKRISIFNNNRFSNYAVTANGGFILREGEVDKEWDKLIQLKLKDCSYKQDILKKFKEISHDEWVLKERIAEDLFYYFIVDREKIPYDELEMFTTWLETQGWNHSLQGRKLYFVPKPVNKRDAVLYLKQVTNEEFVAAAGDSLLDLCMLENADFSIIPAHGEIHELKNISPNITKASQQGIYASEEILKFVLNICAHAAV
ncbi:HAD family hydrolase [Metabacillus fastidiosus]|uniref:HAD hydrolase family protein n=1 Tax=Metabacillus fastidiosus TaxID=1458 RepID=A0ABU6P370_9BACI|nr:HAD hydrolase family protein [Metabacillus fastidiosus]MED4403804.1 HAD hydrolase family protein [Metabacillus fastidiosus]MED4452584.1 HAD hydrolase family protein [Metabacillus fastidiosus]MED4463485.1 HAD hydrolase family protein [Metabacillus fastidiosus]